MRKEVIPAFDQYVESGIVNQVFRHGLIPSTPTSMLEEIKALPLDTFKVHTDFVVKALDSGTVLKDDYGIMALTVLSTADDSCKRTLCYDAISRVIKKDVSRLLRFYAYIPYTGRGYGRAVKSLAAAWYLNTPLAEIEQQVLNCPEVLGVTHAEVLRKSHPKPMDEQRKVLLRYLSLREKPDAAERLRSDIGALSTTLPAFTQYEYFKELANTDLNGFINDLPKLMSMKNLKVPVAALPAQVLSSSEAWVTLVDHMTPDELLSNFHKVINAGFTEALSKKVAVTMRSSRFTPAKKILGTLGDRTLFDPEVRAALEQVAARKVYAPCIPMDIMAIVDVRVLVNKALSGVLRLLATEFSEVRTVVSARVGAQFVVQVDGVNVPPSSPELESISWDSALALGAKMYQSEGLSVPRSAVLVIPGNYDPAMLSDFKREYAKWFTAPDSRLIIIVDESTGADLQDDLDPQGKLLHLEVHELSPDTAGVISRYILK